MEYVYGALLLHSAGKKITEEDMTKVMEAAGVKPDISRVKALIASLEGVNIDDAIKTAAVPVVAAGPASAAGGSAPEKAEGAKDKPKKEEEKKASEEDVAAGLGALFG